MKQAKAAIAAAVLCAAMGTALFIAQRDDDKSGRGLRDLTRGELELRDGDVLYAKGEDSPFDGTMSEYHSEQQKRIEIEIHAGKPHGLSRGWYDNGQLEVEETFVEGVSHGTRRRWYQNGAKKSVATIVDGKIEGEFTRWYDNGQLAAKAEMKDGRPHGLSQAWYRSGQPKSRAVVEGGEVVQREFFDENDDNL